MNRYLKTKALVPSEREKVCQHHFVYFRGAVPCTGPLVCRMCDAPSEYLEALALTGWTTPIEAGFSEVF